MSEEKKTYTLERDGTGFLFNLGLYLFLLSLLCKGIMKFDELPDSPWFVLVIPLVLILGFLGTRYIFEGKRSRGAGIWFIERAGTRWTLSLSVLMLIYSALVLIPLFREHKEKPQYVSYESNLGKYKLEIPYSMTPQESTADGNIYLRVEPEPMVRFDIAIIPFSKWTKEKMTGEKYTKFFLTQGGSDEFKIIDSLNSMNFTGGWPGWTIGRQYSVRNRMKDTVFWTRDYNLIVDRKKDVFILSYKNRPEDFERYWPVYEHMISSLNLYED